MANVKHTPGPWMLPRYEHEVMTVPRGDIKICCVHAVSQNDDGRANGKLIAAAPELLDALEALYMAVYGGNSVSLEDCIKRAPTHDQFEQKIISAIRKARGAN